MRCADGGTFLPARRTNGRGRARARAPVGLCFDAVDPPPAGIASVVASAPASEGDPDSRRSSLSNGELRAAFRRMETRADTYAAELRAARADAERSRADAELARADAAAAASARADAERACAVAERARAVAERARAHAERARVCCAVA